LRIFHGPNGTKWDSARDPANLTFMSEVLPTLYAVPISPKKGTALRSTLPLMMAFAENARKELTKRQTKERTSELLTDPLHRPFTGRGEAVSQLTSTRSNDMSVTIFIEVDSEIYLQVSNRNFGILWSALGLEVEYMGEMNGLDIRWAVDHIDLGYFSDCEVSDMQVSYYLKKLNELWNEAYWKKMPIQWA
jgi:hypothetical protein